MLISIYYILYIVQTSNGICCIAFKVGSSRREGDFEGARSSSRWARNLSIAAIICGLICIILAIVLRAVVLSSSESKTNTYN